jgi:hypothetical protein
MKKTSFLFFLLIGLNLFSLASDMTVDLTKRGGPIKKTGLGNLFGVANIAGGIANKSLLSDALVVVSASQGRIGENGSNPYSTDAIAPLLRGTGVKMICRFNDLCYGWPYAYSNYADWMAQVDNAMKAVISYKDVVLCIAPFNEPDNKFVGKFMTDPAIPSGTYDQRVNWLWTATVRKIRSMDATIPIMGPNYEHYTPWVQDQADRMRAFLVNAIATNTVPDFIGWHNLGTSPGDVPETLTHYYRALEKELNVPGAPLKVIVEEFGSGADNDFEGVPGSVMRQIAEFNRYGVDYACMGIYTNGSMLGNTTRYEFEHVQNPNAGWQLFNWYKSLTGDYVPCSRWDTRKFLSYDGAASYDGNSKTLTILAGGDDDNADIKILGVAGLYGNQVRVRLEVAIWDLFKNEPNANVQSGGDPKTGSYNLFDKTFTCDASGNITVPIHHIDKYNAYRIVVTPVAAPDVYVTKYEAEKATIHNAIVYTNAISTSGAGHVGGIDQVDSYIEYKANVTTRGIYVMNVRYASNGNGGATHTITVNGESQGVVTYDSTHGWSTSELKMVPKRIVLQEGNNTIRFTKGNGYAELDFIDIRPETHRYEAENATVSDSKISSSHYVPNYVGGINNADSYVDFPIETPRTGNYTLTVGYANGTGGLSTHTISVNGVAAGSINFPATSGWLGDARSLLANRGSSSINLYLNSGLNNVRLTKGNGYAELDFVLLSFDEDCNGVSKGTAMIDSCHRCAGGSTGVTPILNPKSCTITGLDTETPAGDQVKIYPNPASSQLTVNSEQLTVSKLSLMDMQGREVYISSEPFAGIKIISLNQLATGFYYLRAKGEGWEKTQKIMVY